MRYILKTNPPFWEVRARRRKHRRLRVWAYTPRVRRGLNQVASGCRRRGAFQILS